MAGIVGLIFTQIVILSPSSLEENDNNPFPVEQSALIEEHSNENKTILADGIPKNKIPDYTIERFSYISTKETEKLWKLTAQKAAMYDDEKLVHARNTKAFLFNPEGTATEVTGREAKYFTDSTRNLEVFGEVHAVFPDGFKIESEYMLYRPNERVLEIPERYLAHGHGPIIGEKTNKPKTLSFTSYGLINWISKAEISLLKDVQLSTSMTTIRSDRCIVFRKNKTAQFTMNPKRPVDSRFITINETDMFAKGRQAELNYDSNDQQVKYLVLHQDVLIKQTTAKNTLKYATGGKADFDSNLNLIILSDFPQVYQDSDTVTGDVIKLHRDSDIVEVEHSNAFSKGN